MQTRPRPTAGEHRPRAAFTLIELLVVISIIAILAGLVTYAAQSAFGRVRETEVKTDIGALENAIADFKVRYGVEPPSSIVLCETGNSSQWSNDAKAKLRKIFGLKFKFDKKYDFNGNGNMTDTSVELNGKQCLMFFLGGPIIGGVPVGFSKNPSYPFNAPQSTSEERIGPFFSPDASRVNVVAGRIGEYAAPGDYGTFMYVRADDYGDAAGTGAFAGLGTFTAYTLPGGSYHKPKSFQIVASGIDGDFGQGGVYDPDNPDDLANEADRDNIANFSNGRLAN